MQKILTLILFFCATKAMAQIPEDAIRYTWYPQNGTARALAIGGAIGSLGGDITSNFVNPAGIGFYKTNEATLSAGFLMNKQKISYKGFQQNDDKNYFGLGTSGVAFAIANENSNTSNTKSASIAFTQKVNFNNIVHYKGFNNNSSYSEVFAEELASGLILKDVLSTKSTSPFTVAPAYTSYLIDTTTIGGKKVVRSLTDAILDAGRYLQQEMTRTTKGGMYEIAGTYAGSDGDKWFWGASLGIPIINFESNTVFKETDTSSITSDQFKAFTFTDNYTTKGVGINGKFGLIYRPKEYIRIGLAIHTPSYMSQEDKRKSSLASTLENPFKDTVINSSTFTDGQERGQARYVQSTPWKYILSGSYVFREVEDVTRQRGFISADIEYVRHGRSKFSSNAEQPTEGDKAYFNQLTTVINDIYKSNVNVKIGGEVKFNTIMARLGFGYYGSPYRETPTNANKMTFSGGLGYRNKGFFADLTYVHLVNNDFDVPYRLQNSLTEYATVKQQTGNIMATIGVKF
jgi:hypothetical protein